MPRPGFEPRSSTSKAQQVLCRWVQWFQRYAHGQTDTQTNGLMTILHTPTMVEYTYCDTHIHRNINCECCVCPALIVVCEFQALLNPVQPVLNCLMYGHVSSVWHDSPSMSHHSNSLSSPSETLTENPLMTSEPTANDSASSLLIFGDT